MRVAIDGLGLVLGMCIRECSVYVVCIYHVYYMYGEHARHPSHVCKCVYVYMCICVYVCLQVERKVLVLGLILYMPKYIYIMYTCVYYTYTLCLPPLYIYI